MILKIKILGQTYSLLEGYIDHFQGQKMNSPDFLKIVLELLRTYLAIGIGPKKPTFWSLLA